MSINECFKPGAGCLVANLEGVCENEGAVVLDEVLELGFREVFGVERAIELLLSNRNGILDGDRWGCRCNLGGLNERGAERSNLVILVECNVRNRVSDRDAIHRLLEVHVAGGLALERRADMDGIGVDAVARLHEGNGGVLDRRVRALRQRVINTLPEGL